MPKIMGTRNREQHTNMLQFYTKGLYSHSTYCDNAPERRKCAVREAPQRHPLL
jgi:hypothetical protein